MNGVEESVLLLRLWIQSTFTEQLQKVCNLKSRMCRGGSKELYKLLINHPETSRFLLRDKDHLQIISGLGHTFIRYKDDLYQRYIYIDPTIGQFVPSFNDIFVGTEKELEELSKVNRSQLNIKDYVEKPEWTGKTHPPLRLENAMMKQRKSRKSRKTRRQRT